MTDDATPTDDAGTDDDEQAAESRGSSDDSPSSNEESASPDDDPSSQNDEPASPTDGITTPIERGASEAPERSPNSANERMQADENERQPPEPSPEQIRGSFLEGARRIEAPGGDPVSTGVVVDVTVDAGVLTVTVDVAGVPQGVGARVGDQLRGLGLALPGVEHVRIQAIERATDDGGGIRPHGVDCIVVVAGAKGGVGKSTLTTAIARTLDERGLSVGIFDADFEASDLGEALDPEGPITPSASGDPVPVDVDGIQFVSVELVAGDRPASWRGAVVDDVLADLLGNADWDDRDVLLVDLPPGQGPIANAIFQQVAVDAALLVSTPADVAVRNARRTAGLVDAVDVPTAAVVSNMASVPDGDAEPVFQTGERSPEALTAAVEGRPPLVEVPFDPGFQQLRGARLGKLHEESRAATARLADAVLDVLSARSHTLPSEAVNLRGLPPRLSEQEAELEVAAPDGPRPVAVDDAAAIVPILENAIGGEAAGTIRVEDVEDGGQLVYVDPAT